MKSDLGSKKLPPEFYQRDAVIVARDLLGKIFCKRIGDKLLSGRILETEAYKGDIDEAAHSYGGKTKRNEVMFYEGGFLYVYFIYGIHYCANVVTGPEGQGDAVLIRAVEPVIGLDTMISNRYGSSKLNKIQMKNLTNGPAKFAKAFDISIKDNGKSLSSDEFYILDDELKVSFERTKRIGISKSKDLLWRFNVKD